jgi:hypothetical protein
VQVLHAFSGIIGESIGMVRLACFSLCRLYADFSRYPSLQRRHYIFVGIDALLVVRRPLSVSHRISEMCDIRQAAKDVSSSYDAVVDLFECIGNFLKRLGVHIKITPTPEMIDIIVKIMVEVISVLALATKQIKQGRFSKYAVIHTSPETRCAVEKFAKKLLGESEVESVLQRLDRLTQDEARMTVTQTLDVVNGLMNSVRIVMDGTRCFG